MNATRLLCFVLLISSQACKDQITSSVEEKDLQCDKLVDRMIIAERDFVAALHSVRDLETAKGSVDRIRECADRLDTICEEFARLGPLSPALRARLLNKLEMEDRKGSAMTRESVRVLKGEEQNVIIPAAEKFFDKWGTLSMKSGLESTAEEYQKRRAQQNGAANEYQPVRSETNSTSSAAGPRR